jgi:hypothetical protein
MNKYLLKIATMVEDTQASSDVTPTQPGPNSFPQNGQSSEDEEFNQRDSSNNEMPESNDGTQTVNDPVRLSDRILRHIAETYGPERDPEHEESFDAMAFIDQIKSRNAINEVDQVNAMDPNCASEGPNGTSSEEGISETSTRY